MDISPSFLHLENSIWVRKPPPSWWHVPRLIKNWNMNNHWFDSQWIWCCNFILGILMNNLNLTSIGIIVGLRKKMELTLDILGINTNGRFSLGHKWIFLNFVVWTLETKASIEKINVSHILLEHFIAHLNGDKLF